MHSGHEIASLSTDSSVRKLTQEQSLKASSESMNLSARSTHQRGQSDDRYLGWHHANRMTDFARRQVQSSLGGGVDVHRRSLLQLPRRREGGCKTSRSFGEAGAASSAPGFWQIS